MQDFLDLARDEHLSSLLLDDDRKWSPFQDKCIRAGLRTSMNIQVIEVKHSDLNSFVIVAIYISCSMAGITQNFLMFCCRIL